MSSDMIELESEREIAETDINELNLRAILFERFPASSRSPVAAYVEGVQRCHIFVMILWQSFPGPVKKEYEEAVRRAKPVLIFRKRLNEGEKRSEDLAKFLEHLEGHDQAPFAIRTTFHEFRKLEALSGSLRDALATEIAKSYQTTRISTTREQLYDLGTEIIQGAQKRLYIVQRTPALFLGPRKYLAPEGQKKHFEKRFVDELTNWIECARTDPKRTLLYPFSVPNTRDALDNIESESGSPGSVDRFRLMVANRIAKYKEIERESGDRLRFLPLSGPFSGPMAVGDNRFAVWILGKDSAVSLSQENDSLATHLAEQLDQHVEENVQTETILAELGLTASQG
ncbi:MAG: DUF4062 domain-containing protein [Terriglobales bacterium]